MNRNSIFCVVSLILLCAVSVSRSAAIRKRRNDNGLPAKNASDYNVFRFDGIIMNQLQLPNISENDLNETLVDPSVNLQILNISNHGIESLSATILNYPNLKFFVAPQNRLTEIPEALFINAPVVTEVDFSYNEISEIHPHAFRNATKIAILSLAYNEISLVENETFSTLFHLHTLDLSNNRIQSIDQHLFKTNVNLRELRLENNPIQRLDKQIFWPILNLPLLELYISCENARDLDTSHFGRALEWQIDTDASVSLKSTKSMSKMECMTGGKFTNLRYFNCSGNGLQNTAEIIDLLGKSIETLDVSANHVGKINAHTFKPFVNLKYLNLSQTQLDNFGFNTFYHQRRLQTLDISHNHLGSVNFTLFFRIFRHLKTLNLEGNNLHEVNSVTKMIFPKLALLGISKNSFSCDYLTKFLRQWDSLSLMDNPSSNRMHIDGIDCFDDDNRVEALIKSDQMPNTATRAQSPTQMMASQFGSMTKSTQMYNNNNNNNDKQYRIRNYRQAISYPIVWTYPSNNQFQQFSQKNAIVNSYPVYYYSYQ